MANATRPTDVPHALRLAARALATVEKNTRTLAAGCGSYDAANKLVQATYRARNRASDLLCWARAVGYGNFEPASDELEALTARYVATRDTITPAFEAGLVRDREARETEIARLRREAREAAPKVGSWEHELACMGVGYGPTYTH